MNIAGYKTGAVACQAAFIADFDVDPNIPTSVLVSKIETDRGRMDVRRGMRSKYVPLRFDPATGAHQIGGRYLYDAWDDVLDYMRFTSEELEFEPGIKFWDRSFFTNIDKRAWQVVGAHDFTPLQTHYVSRFERFVYESESVTKALEAVWPVIRDAAEKEGSASIWLLIQPTERQIGLLTVGTQFPGNDEAERASRTLAELEHAESLSRLIPGEILVQPVFDRTSLNLSVWLPRSRSAGGDSSIFPTYPVHPLPNR